MHHPCCFSRLLEYTGFMFVKLEWHLMLFTFGGLGIWWFIDLIMITTASFRDKEGRPIPYDNTPVINPSSNGDVPNEFA